MMARVSAPSYRKFRCKLYGRKPLYRRPLGVRYPHGEGGFDGSYAAWGGGPLGYSRRSFLDAQPDADVQIDDNTATDGRFPGGGEPRFDVAPARDRNARQLLMTGNSKRDVLEWKHTHTWNKVFNTHDSGNLDQYVKIDEDWWNFVGYAGITHPTIYGEDSPSPVPLTDEAVFARADGTFLPVDFPQPICVDGIDMYSRPGLIGKTIIWKKEHLWPYQLRIRRTCRRYIYYENCIAEDAGGWVQYTLGHIRHIVREIDPRRIYDPEWDHGGTEPPAPDPKYMRNYNDCRFIPFGITDAHKYWTPDPNPTHPSNILKGLFWLPNYEQSTDFPPASTPPAFYDEYAAMDSFTSNEVKKISKSKIFDGMRYMAQPWARKHSVADGHSRLVPKRSFDLLVAADFLNYWLYHYNESSGVKETAETGFAGAYGTCYAIY